jgi:predicted dinucleotide-binding enzyme
MKIAILGAGNMVSTLGRAWVNHGHKIFFGVKNTTDEKTQALIQEIGSNASTSSIAEAAKNAEVVVLTTPWGVTQQVIADCGDLTGKIVIDCTNPLSADFSSLSVGLTSSGGEQVAAWVTYILHHYQ